MIALSVTCIVLIVFLVLVFVRHCSCMEIIKRYREDANRLIEMSQRIISESESLSEDQFNLVTLTTFRLMGTQLDQSTEFAKLFANGSVAEINEYVEKRKNDK